MKAYIEKISFNGKIVHGRYIGIDEVLFKGRSKYQEIVIAKNRYFGRMLILDNAIQFAERDEFIYHEMLVHPAMAIHPNPKDVLILGGGDGLALREVLKHNIDYVKLIDIDEMVISTSKTYFSDLTNNSFNDERADITIGDAIEYVNNPDRKYDIVILDLVDPQGDLNNDYFFNKEMIHKYKSLLKDKGILVTHAETVEESSNYVALRINELFRRIIGNSVVYEAFIPSFYYPWNYVITSKDEITCKGKIDVKTRYINDDILKRICQKREQWVEDMKEKLKSKTTEELFNGTSDTSGEIKEINI